MNRGRLLAGIGTGTLVGMILLLPTAARAILGVPAEPQVGSAPELLRRAGPSSPIRGHRPVLVRRVEKATVRAEASVDRAVEERVATLLPPPRASTPVVRESIVELTKPTSLRIFRVSTPHNHRAPPDA